MIEVLLYAVLRSMTDELDTHVMSWCSSVRAHRLPGKVGLLSCAFKSVCVLLSA